MKPVLIGFLLLFGAACTKTTPAPTVTAASPASTEWQNIKQTIRQKFPTVKQLSTDELAARLKEKTPPLLLDARAPGEFSVSHLSQAHNVANDQQLTATLQGAAKDQPIVTYCAVGYRSSALAEKLKQQGFTNVANLEGSIFQWANEGRPLFQGERQVTQVHPFDAKWGELLKPELRAPLP